MPTTQPLDEDELGEKGEGQIKAIAGFAKGGTPVAGTAPKRTNTAQPAALTSSPRPVPSAQQHSEKKPLKPVGADLKRPNIRLNPVANQTPALSTGMTEKPSVNRLEKRNNPYTDADVAAAWERFIGANEQEHLLVNAMRMAFPKRLNGDIFAIAQSSVHIGLIRKHEDRILAYLKNSISNDNITFEYEEVSEDSPLVWNDRELLKRMTEEDPALSEFISSLKLRLSHQ